jgi:quercetin dioxygenase-like cupin family protein
MDFGGALVDGHDLEWKSHPRFPTIGMKMILSSSDNPLASLNLVRVPAKGVIGRHVHQEEVETVYVLSGESVLTVEDSEVVFSEGQAVVIPKGIEHGLRNETNKDVQLLTIFTPPIE